MGWTAGQLEGPFTARAAIEFDLGSDFTARVIDAVRYGKVVYAAVRAHKGDEIFGLVLLTEREKGVLYTKPVTRLSSGKLKGRQCEPKCSTVGLSGEDTWVSGESGGRAE